MLASNVKNHVHFPRNVDEWNIIKEKFYQMYKMPGIGGCIDCTHIKIQKYKILEVLIQKCSETEKAIFP